MLPEEKASSLGRIYGETNRLEDVQNHCEELYQANLGVYGPLLSHNSCEAMYREAIALGCPFQWFDIFKYAAQSVWHKKKEEK